MAKRKARGAVPQVRKPRVAIAYVSPGTESSYFSYSYTRAMAYERETWGATPHLIQQRCASGQLVEARNEVIRFFLDETEPEWLLCVDSDMGFAHDLIERLLAVADKDARPVVGALCFGLKKHGTDHDLQSVTLRCFPTLYTYEERETEVGFAAMTDYPRNQLVQVAATGAACFVVHRTVLEKMRTEFGDAWFDLVVHPRKTKPFGEDLSFFTRCAGIGVPVYVHTGVQTSHDKGGVCLTEATWDEQQFLAANYPAYVKK